MKLKERKVRQTVEDSERKVFIRKLSTRVKISCGSVLTTSRKRLNFEAPEIARFYKMEPADLMQRMAFPISPPFGHTAPPAAEKIEIYEICHIAHFSKRPLFCYRFISEFLFFQKKIVGRFFEMSNTVEIVYNDIGYNDEPDITTEL